MCPCTSRGRSLIGTILLLPALAWAGGCGGSAEAPAVPPPTAISVERGQPIPDAVLVPWLEYHRIPGASIAVASGGRIDRAKGYGIADAVTRRPVTTDTGVVAPARERLHAVPHP